MGWNFLGLIDGKCNIETITGEDENKTRLMIWILVRVKSTKINLECLVQSFND